MSRARFIAAARLEYLAEVIYYSEAEAGLGRRFAAAVEEATARALRFLSPVHRAARIPAVCS